MTDTETKSESVSKLPHEPNTVTLLRKQNLVNGTHYVILKYIDELRSIIFELQKK